jgi:glycosyltransferase involved in cell wall biosynthesis
VREDSVVVFQLGAREHYAVPRMLDGSGRLRALVTDAWVPPESKWTRLPGAVGKRFAGRFEPALANCEVIAFNSRLLAFEAAQRLSPPPSYWHGCMRRNEWFEGQAVRAATRRGLFAGRPTAMAYSYAALGILKAAKSAGCRTVLLQIDPAIMEDRIVRRECARWERVTGKKAPWIPPPASYWHRWKRETELADRIIVNSEWSREALERAGVEAQKIRVVPLAYDPPREALAYQRSFPERFSQQRPLRVLFLGSLILRKGIARIFDAIRDLRGEPVVFRFVGTPEVDLPKDLADSKQVEWLGAVPRSEVHEHYKWADVFLFPTLSDGFGLTQLEAAAWGLPLIVSRRCGEVVRDGEEGWVVSTPSGSRTAVVLRRSLQEVEQLKTMSTRTRTRTAKFEISRIAADLATAILE